MHSAFDVTRLRITILSLFRQSAFLVHSLPFFIDNSYFPHSNYILPSKHCRVYQFFPDTANGKSQMHKASTQSPSLLLNTLAYVNFICPGPFSQSYSIPRLTDFTILYYFLKSILLLVSWLPQLWNWLPSVKSSNVYIFSTKININKYK